MNTCIMESIRIKRSEILILTPVAASNENGIGDDPAFESAYWRRGPECTRFPR